MPEGDTIFRAATTLRQVLAGRPLKRLSSSRLGGRTPAPGTVVDDVEARGKHLLVHFSDGTTLRTHMRMTGSWHIYRPGERWRKPAHLARVVIEVPDAVAVCFAVPVVELLATSEIGRHPPLARLGPDLTADDADIDAAVARMDAIAAPEDEIADVLLDQRVACGVGNIYKSETLFACGVSPFRRVGELDRSERTRLLATASKLLRANRGTHARTTIAGGVAVYGRARQPCRRCGALIQVRRQGSQARLTYWCPRCQP